MATEESTLETLESYLGESHRKPLPLVVSSPDPDAGAPPLPSQEEYEQTGPKRKWWVKREVSATQEIGEYLIECLNRRTEPFDRQWLVWKGSEKGLRKGKLVFAVQRSWKDGYRRCKKARITIRVPKAPLWRRIVSFYYRCKHELLRISQEAAKCISSTSRRRNKESGKWPGCGFPTSWRRTGSSTSWWIRK